jgi:micrococcal nuclease
MRRALLLCLALSACTRPAPPSSGGIATVDHVVDGDTAVVELNGREETIRFLGIDTPETVDPDQPPECFGHEASDHTKALLPPGTEVRLTRDVEARDRYDRLLVYVERAEDGLFVNLDLVQGGWADDLPFPPNTAHAREFALAVATARREGLGLWGACGNADTPA